MSVSYPLNSATLANPTTPFYGGGGGGGGGNVVIGSGQATSGTRTATFWEVGDLLFCAVLISTAGNPPYTLGNGAFVLPTGKAWLTGSQPGFPQVICSALSNTTPGTGFPYIANAKINNIPGANQTIQVQCVGGDPSQPNAWQGVSADVNVLAWGPKAPAP